MRITRVEIEGANGKVKIERKAGDATIHIESTVFAGGDVKRWSFPGTISGITEKKLFAIASTVQQRCDGFVGTGGDISGYYSEIQRFMN